ncbi:PREDICTED: ecotropic viral integration site 5 ortholog isoform X1 [Bactrocera latifrons]|uniref:ecotropic viral integration site 5 ortholog isoform X1 n=1 Tax=Bactrocera latifrons TaxID=174628 RepID=UPI0008DC5FED|nr:PREDICTED: ecotropic viral integration site 5 ortholog isoform X1 [Bactrocera latifrons]XP_018786852.1 PREDICTED: ecotropic viral integration site 5 ortholog isoform X1 [Bactrocera latifrons]XP_018786853.1 PREDICTED: ecotropic viral integration site 5 ortholog isoform X1 [Bactrocera latifrons]XP_039958925.1 ecotropic viral integration site 5 ortholog isoform X1 [Bactrocera tryoni]XP_039958926.1 ecotropic viral integration site 5 ortholog isoform X1 [Bactrocera tryoni]XP_050330526.1 ecotropi
MTLTTATQPESSKKMDAKCAAEENLPSSEMDLLAKLEAANKLIESDAKSLNSLHSTHSRKNSDTSQISLNSSKSGNSNAEEDIWTQWATILSDWEGALKRKNPCVRDLVRRGIPHHFRAIVWQQLCGASDTDKKQYADYIKATSACEKVIRRDIARTYPEVDFFKEKDGPGQEALFNVIKAYSLHDREVGYCQGSGFIVGLLLMQMPEEEAFAVLVQIMQQHRMRDMFKPSMSELGLCMYQLESLVQEQIPEMHIHFQQQGFQTTMYASSWFLTLYTTTLNLNLSCRIMDVFLSEGMEFIFKVALALLLLGKETLLCLDMEAMLKFFQKELPGRVEADPEAFFNLAYSIKINTKRMKKMEKEYQDLKKKEQEEMVELRRLRRENRLLKQRNDLLEAESAELADRLVRGQVSRAEEEETSYAIQTELMQLRRSYLEVSHQLENANEEVRGLSLRLQENNVSIDSVSNAQPPVKEIKNNSRQSSIDELCMKEEALKQRDEMVSCLLEELVKVRQSLAESEDQIRNLKSKIEELEEDKKTLRETTPDNSVAHLQDELIASKLREAEASLSLKDLKQRVQELSTQWQRQLQENRNDHSQQPVDSTPKKLLTNFFDTSKSNEHTQRLEEELMTTRIREMETLTELKELRLKVMELETQVQVSTNQLRRQDEENKKLREQLEQAVSREKEMANKAREQQHRYSDLESRMKDELMNVKIKFTEQSQTVAELKQEISRLETKNSEILAEGELRSNLDESDKVRDLQDRLADLKAELTAIRSRGKYPINKLRSSSIQSIESNEIDFNELNMRRESAELSTT